LIRDSKMGIVLSVGMVTKNSPSINEKHYWHHTFRKHFERWTPTHVLALTRIIASVFITGMAGPKALAIVKAVMDSN
jgi:hypothetical protein